MHKVMLIPHLLLFFPFQQRINKLRKQSHFHLCQIIQEQIKVSQCHRNFNYLNKIFVTEKQYISVLIYAN